MKGIMWGRERKTAAKQQHKHTHTHTNIRVTFVLQRYPTSDFVKIEELTDDIILLFDFKVKANRRWTDFEPWNP